LSQKTVADYRGGLTPAQSKTTVDRRNPGMRIADLKKRITLAKPPRTQRVTIDWSTRMSIASMATSHSEPSEVIREISNLGVAAGARSHFCDCRFQFYDLRFVPEGRRQGEI
jgi:hypothetical protein